MVINIDGSKWIKGASLEDLEQRYETFLEARTRLWTIYGQAKGEERDEVYSLIKSLDASAKKAAEIVKRRKQMIVRGH